MAEHLEVGSDNDENTLEVLSVSPTAQGELTGKHYSASSWGNNHSNRLPSTSPYTVVKGPSLNSSPQIPMPETPETPEMSQFTSSVASSRLAQVMQDYIPSKTGGINQDVHVGLESAISIQDNNSSSSFKDELKLKYQSSDNNSKVERIARLPDVDISSGFPGVSPFSPSSQRRQQRKRSGIYKKDLTKGRAGEDEGLGLGLLPGDEENVPRQLEISHVETLRQLTHLSSPSHSHKRHSDAEDESDSEALTASEQIAVLKQAVSQLCDHAIAASSAAETSAAAFTALSNTIKQPQPPHNSEKFSFVMRNSTFDECRVDLESSRRQAETLSWKLERMRYGAHLKRKAELQNTDSKVKEGRPSKPSAFRSRRDEQPFLWGSDEAEDLILLQDIEIENRALMADKIMLQKKVSDSSSRLRRLEAELRHLRVLLMTAHAPIIQNLDDDTRINWCDGEGMGAKKVLSNHSMGDARSEHLLLAGKRLNRMYGTGSRLAESKHVRESHTNDICNAKAQEFNIAEKEPTTPIVSSFSQRYSGDQSTPGRGLENLISAAESVFSETPRTPQMQSSPLHDARTMVNSLSQGGDVMTLYSPLVSGQSEPVVVDFSCAPIKQRSHGQKDTFDKSSTSALDFLADAAANQKDVSSPIRSPRIHSSPSAINLGPPVKFTQSIFSSPPPDSRASSQPSSATKRLRWDKIPLTPATYEESTSAAKKSRSPYQKWTSHEDRLLNKAVALHGQKWDVVSKMIGSRTYHQSRQRWLRKNVSSKAHLDGSGPASDVKIDDTISLSDGDISETCDSDGDMTLTNINPSIGAEP